MSSSECFLLSNNAGKQGLPNPVSVIDDRLLHRAAELRYGYREERINGEMKMLG